MATTTGCEVIFDLDAPAFSSDDFRMFEFKVKRCPRVRPHDWACCPFSHANEKAKRRDPRLCKYSGTACPEFRRNGCCRRADSCPFAHGIFECWMHPSRYRTQMCSEVLECKRRVCFFAHTESELRRPVDDATWMQQHTALEAAAEAGGMFQESDLASLTLQKLQNKHQLLATQQSIGGLIPAVPSATQGPGVWPLLQQLASSGQIDATQLLQLVQAMGPQQATPAASMTPVALPSEGSTDLGQVAATLASLQTSSFPTAASMTPDDASIAGSAGGAPAAPTGLFAGAEAASGLSTATSGLSDAPLGLSPVIGHLADSSLSKAEAAHETKDAVASVMALVQQLDLQLDGQVPAA